MSSSTKNKVLVVGGGGGGSNAVDTTQFVTHLTTGTPPGQGDGGGGGNEVHWPITTKYYRADLALHLAETDEQPAEGVEEGNMHPLVARGEDLQGLILLCEASVPPDEEPDAQLARLKPWMAAASSQDGLELCLVVGVVGAEGPQGEDADGEEDTPQRRRMLWCLDYGFEYIEVDYAAPPSSKLLRPELREKEGMERVRECIEATSWQHLDLVQQEGRGAAGGGEDKEGQAQGGEAQGGNKAYSPPRHHQDGAQGGSSQEGRGNAGHGGVEEGDDDRLDELFAKIRAVRESAGQYDDAQRRARAAETAMRLADILGIYDDNE